LRAGLSIGLRMQDRALETLFHYLEGDTALLESSRDVLFLRAQVSAQLAILSQKNLVCHQTFKYDADLLTKRGYEVVTAVGNDRYDLCLFLGSKQRDENLVTFAQGISALRPGGLFVCSLSKELGASR